LCIPYSNPSRICLTVADWIVWGRNNGLEPYNTGVWIKQRQLGYTPAPQPVVQTQARTYTPPPPSTPTYSAPTWPGSYSSYGSSGMTYGELQDRADELEEQLQDVEQRVQNMEDER
jgi:hypothetical protein